MGVLSAGEMGASGVLGGFQYPLKALPISGRAVPIPHCHAVGQHALYRAPIEAHQDLGTS